MMKRSIVFLLLIVLALTAGVVNAQTSTPTDSSVTIFIVICDTRAVVNFSGNMLAGYDVYYQIFSTPGGTGTAITALRQVPVNGAYTFSEVVNYDAGSTVAAGATASVKVVIAREGNPASTTFETVVTDLQDGCAEPQFATGTSADAGSGTTTTSVNAGPLIRSPFGDYVNPGYDPQAPDVVVIGARNFALPRHKTPGLIFAECNDYPRAFPGLIYDTDNVVVFWSWYAKTEEQVQQHIDNAIYAVGTFGTNPFMHPVVVSPIEKRGANYWVFYTVTLGNVKPGSYPIGFNLTWKAPITDGYEDFGPGTANEVFNSNCDFTVAPNPDGRAVSYTFP